MMIVLMEKTVFVIIYFKVMAFSGQISWQQKQVMQVSALVGVLLTLVGNVFVLMQPRPVARSRKSIAKAGFNEAQGL